MIVTAHAPNFLPGMSVITKLAAADAWIVEDVMQFSRGGYTNRNRLTDKTWVTVPVPSGSTGLPINQVLLPDDPYWRREVIRSIRHAWPGPVTDEIATVIGRPWRTLVGLNMAVLNVLLRELAPDTEPVLMSHLLSGTNRHPDASECLAAMVSEVGGITYLSGPSGRGYLNETPFAARGITVTYWQHDGPNPCALETIPALQEAA